MESALEIFLNILQILVLIPVIFAAFGLVADNESPVFSALFTLAMVSLALEDIYWITYDLLQGTRSTRVPGRGWSLVFLIVSTAVIVLHFCVLLVPPEAGKLLDLGNYALMFGLCASLFVLSLRALLQKREGTVFPTFFTFFWSRIVIYMSSAAFYCLALFFNILSIPLMLVSVKDQVRSGATGRRTFP